MRITLLTYGSRGDIQPFVALADGLRAAGHQPTLAAPYRFAQFAAQYQIPFVPLPGDPEELSERINDSRHSLPQMIGSMNEYVLSIAAPVWQSAKSACLGAEIIIHSFLFTTGAHSLARQMGVPDISIQLFPTFAPTHAFPMVAAPNLPAGLLSYFSHWLGVQTFWHIGKIGFERLKKIDSETFDMQLFWPFERDIASPTGNTPLIFAYSPQIIPRPGDWQDPGIFVTGYFFLNEAEKYTPQPKLIEFLSQNEPPVCISFGSMISKESARTAAAVGEALKSTGQRGVILTGWGSEVPEIDPQRIICLQSAPHDWLLPYCKAIIHHGGAGTTAAALRAGIPNIIIPHGADQPFWGNQVSRLGVGPKPLAVNTLNGKNLAFAIQTALTPVVQAKASEIGKLIRAENGVGAAIEIIEAHANRVKRQRNSTGIEKIG